jgi:hypothetical protein
VLVVRVIVVAAANEIEIHAIDAAAVARDDATDLRFSDETLEFFVVGHRASSTPPRS